MTHTRSNTEALQRVITEEQPCLYFSLIVPDIRNLVSALVSVPIPPAEEILQTAVPGLFVGWRGSRYEPYRTQVLDFHHEMRLVYAHASDCKKREVCFYDYEGCSGNKCLWCRTKEK